MTWLKLSIVTDEKYAHDVGDFLELFGASAISFSAATDEKLFENFGQSEHSLWQLTEVSGLLPQDVDMDILLVCLRDRVGSDAIKKRTIVPLNDADWVEDYKRSVPVHWFGPELCICPSWITPPKAKLSPIVLDPGLAFGTGTHSTTRLCIEWLVSLDLSGKVVVDYGCGSGILALAACRLGADRVFAVDIDPQAITATKDNAQRNDVAHLITAGLPDEVLLPKVPVLVANLLLNPILELSKTLSEIVEPGGRIGLSGLLAHQVEDCLASFDQWFKLDTPVIEQEWALISGTKK